jgi:serine/threonine protein phosphatase 1
LAQILTAIDADIAGRPARQVIEVFVGDYVDRGPQSKEVLDIMISRGRRGQTVCLKGNHETYILNFIRNPEILAQWKNFGGLETLVSYGLMPSINPDENEQKELAAVLDRTLPEGHRRFLSGLPISFTCGDYFFAHAGVRPGVPLAQQTEEDLLSIRKDFLLHKKDFDKMVVHGHTPVSEPDVRPNRINIDTGAYATGQLTCLVLEDEDISFI